MVSSFQHCLLTENPPLRHGVHQTFKPPFLFAADDALGSKKLGDETLRILIVEDDFLVATNMEYALREAGFNIAGVVATAEEAVELAITERVGLVIMDIRLAGRRDGVEAAIELFNSHGIRCIFATAHGDAETRKRAETARPLDWLQKPYSMFSLLESVRKSLNMLSENN